MVGCLALDGCPRVAPRTQAALLPESSGSRDDHLPNREPGEHMIAPATVQPVEAPGGTDDEPEMPEAFITIMATMLRKEWDREMNAQQQEAG